MSITVVIEPQPVILETKRLILRPWRESDAGALYLYASDPDIGPKAGWWPHESVQYSRNTIRTILSHDNIFAITIKGEGSDPVGSIGMTIGENRARGRAADEGELGYWIGVPYWNQGYITEAATEVLRYAFGELSLAGVWGCYYDGNAKSRHVLDKLGFSFVRTEGDSYNPLMEKRFIEHYMFLANTRTGVI